MYYTLALWKYVKGEPRVYNKDFWVPVELAELGYIN